MQFLVDKIHSLGNIGIQGCVSSLSQEKELTFIEVFQKM